MNIYVIQVRRTPIGKKAAWCDKEDHLELTSAVPALDALRAKGKRSYRVVQRLDIAVRPETIQQARKAAKILGIE